MGNSAKATDGSFEIVGEGKVIQQYLIGGKMKDVTYTHALHSATLNLNLISISAFNRAGLSITFGRRQEVVQKENGETVLTVYLEKGMYLSSGTGDLCIAAH
jgi:hypothetical protein